MVSKSWLIRFAAVMLVVPAFACTSDDDTDIDIEAETETPPPAMAPVTVQFQPMGGSTLAGEVVASHNPENVNVRVTLSGLAEDDDYEAALKYGMCTDAQAHLDNEVGDDTPGTETETPGAIDEHEAGEEFADIDLDHTGMTATGSADIDTDDLRANEPAYLAITTGGMNDERTIVACADLSGHGGMNIDAAPGTPGTEPATEPAAR
jgi:hypothetical protein